jgi:CRISPR-associated protein Cas2
MRTLCFFDLPVLTVQDKREYRKFRKYLIKSGFLQEQESVYSKLVQNISAADAIIENVRKNKPPTGLVQILKVTEKQYENMDFIVGQRITNVLDSDERLVIL